MAETAQSLVAVLMGSKSDWERIQPRTTTSISLVGTDGGNNKIQYDPFLIQLIRVVELRGSYGTKEMSVRRVKI